jgi:hypothetical protein
MYSAAKVQYFFDFTKYFVKYVDIGSNVAVL